MACFVAASWAVPSPGAPAPDRATPVEPVPEEPFQEGVPAMQRYCIAEIKKAERLEEGSAGRKETLDGLIAYMERRRDFYEGPEVRGVCLWLSYCLARARALSGDPNGAYRELDVLLNHNTGGHTAAARRFVDDLKLRAFHLKAKTAFGDEDYDLCIRTVDDMFTPLRGFAWALSSDAGCAAWILRARSLYLKEKPDHPAAFEACRKLLRRGRGNWPNNARELMHEVLVAAGRDGTGLALKPKDFSEAALGAYRLALGAKDEARRRRLLDEAVSLYERTIAACRANEVTGRDRLELEPSAWLAMGICYSKLELWYEAASAFEGALVHSSRENVARLLAESSWDAGWRHFAERKGLAEPGARERDLYLAFYEKLGKDVSFRRSLAEHETRLAKCAKNLVVACRRRFRESGRPFDEERLHRARRVAAPFLGHDADNAGNAGNGDNAGAPRPREADQAGDGPDETVF